MGVQGDVRVSAVLFRVQSVSRALLLHDVGVEVGVSVRRGRRRRRVRQTETHRRRVSGSRATARPDQQRRRRRATADLCAAASSSESDGGTGGVHEEEPQDCQNLRLPGTGRLLCVPRHPLRPSARRKASFPG